MRGEPVGSDHGGAVLVAQSPESDDELTGGCFGERVGALAEDLAIHVVMGAVHFTVRHGAEGEAGELLTSGCDGEGGSVHGVRCFDPFNIQESEGSDQSLCQLVDCPSDPGGDWVRDYMKLFLQIAEA